MPRRVGCRDGRRRPGYRRKTRVLEIEGSPGRQWRREQNRVPRRNRGRVLNPPASEARVGWKRAITGVWFACVIAGSLLPLHWKTILRTNGPLHVPLHFAVFAISGMLTFGFSRSISGKILICSALIGLAFVLEGLQRAFNPIRFEWRDVLTDGGGVLAAVFFASLSPSRTSR